MYAPSRTPDGPQAKPMSAAKWEEIGMLCNHHFTRSHERSSHEASNVKNTATYRSPCTHINHDAPSEPVMPSMMQPQTASRVCQTRR